MRCKWVARYCTIWPRKRKCSAENPSFFLLLKLALNLRLVQTSTYKTTMQDDTGSLHCVFSVVTIMSQLYPVRKKKKRKRRRRFWLLNSQAISLISLWRASNFEWKISDCLNERKVSRLSTQMLFVYVYWGSIVLWRFGVYLAIYGEEIISLQEIINLGRGSFRFSRVFVVNISNNLCVCEQPIRCQNILCAGLKYLIFL